MNERQCMQTFIRIVDNENAFLFYLVVMGTNRPHDAVFLMPLAIQFDYVLVG